MVKKSEMNTEYFFEIPFYRNSLKEFTDEKRKSEEDEFKEIKNIEKIQEVAPQSLSNYINNVINKEIPEWKYNEIIGWIYLRVSGDKIKAEYSYINKKRIIRWSRIKRYVSKGRAFETKSLTGLSSEEIHAEVILTIQNFQKERFKKRHFDLSSFKMLKPYLDLAKLVEENNQFRKLI